MLEFVDAVGRYGLPTVAAGIILWLYVRSERRQEVLLDRWECRMFGDENGNRGKLSEAHDVLRTDITHIQSDLDIVKQQVEKINQREDIADAGRFECHQMFDGINKTLIKVLEELSQHGRRLDQLETSFFFPTSDGKKDA